MSEEIREIPLDQIDDPQVAMRSDIHDDGIEELASSIKSVGLIQPILVRPRGDRFEVIAGHRRTTAARLAGKILIPAIVRNSNESETTTLKLHENLLRRDVNPVDEAIFLSRVMKEQKLTIKEICEITRRSESYILSRVEILDYPDYLIEALGEEQISLGSAHWLNKITDDKIRRSYTGYAINGGISVKRAMAWQQSWQLGQNYSNPLDIEEADSESGEPRPVHKEECVICRDHDIPNAMMLYYAHMDCVRRIQE